MDRLKLLGTLFYIVAVLSLAGFALTGISL